MGGLNTSLYIGVQALEASQGALNATSNNIANSNTPGYTREVAQFSEGPQVQVNGQILGGGVTLDRIAKRAQPVAESADSAAELGAERR